MEFLNPGFTHKDLLNIPEEKLPDLASEVRAVILNTVKKNGGHLGSSLGAVDLTIALLRKFDPVNDRIIFDVGHQSYPYKILTDRFDKFSTLRLKNGICGFPRRSESPCDHFNTGHSSTSISAALGYAKARDLLNEKRNIIAFIGDAALINGLALEALNYVQETKTKIIIVLNDNKHSISNRVGGFSTLLAKLSANTLYNKIKNAIRKSCLSLPNGNKIYKKLAGIRNHIKNLLIPENFFDDLGINYWGPFDGHDIKTCETIFELAKNYERPVLLHFSTIKGKGFPEAEKNPTKYHQMSPESESKKKKIRTWSEAASQITEELALKDSRIVCLTAAMATGVKLEHFSKEFPERFFDVGIAESHMLTMSAGLAAGGLRPLVFIYSTFLQRAMDQLVHDIALQNLPVVLMVDRAGLVGSDGDTHQGLLDISWSRPIPNLEIYSPCDEKSLRQVMEIALKRNSPTLIRYPRGEIINQEINSECENSETKNSGIIKISDGYECALLGHGTMINIMYEAKNLALQKNLPTPAIYNVQRIKPLDKKILSEILERYEIIATLEENYLIGGLGEAVAAFIAEKNYHTRLFRFGVPDVCVQHATSKEQREFFGLTPENIISKIFA